MMSAQIIPVGLCQCGCGALTRISPVNDKSKGWIKGQPVRYLKGHTIKGGGKGEKALRWKGGRSLSSHGYVVIQTPEGRKYEHIMIAEKVLGRPLPYFGVGDPRNIVVHHVDGNKQNNAYGNLLICTHSYHAALHKRLEKSNAWPEFRKGRMQ